ncbi:MAG: hypothetical protein E7380_06045 [Clostridiales bacterium]|nr:hypothetical protein [Clostridiales bacterium]
MDKIQLLQERKAKLVAAGKQIREDIAAIVDEDSFVELSAFSFSKNEFYSEEIAGEGVITGFATLDGYPFYIVGQNFSVQHGGLSEAHCNKIVKCLQAAEKNNAPVIYLLNSQGLQIGEGVSALEGMGKLFKQCSSLNGRVRQYAIVNGEVYGSSALLAAIADFAILVEKKSVLAVNSPFVLSAKSGKNLDKEAVGGVKALDKTGISSVVVSDLSAAREAILSLSSILNEKVVDSELNAHLPALNEAATAENLLQIFDEAVEINKGVDDSIKTVIGRIGGISVAALIFDGKEKGVELNAKNMARIKDFLTLAYLFEIPFVTFVDTLGIEPTLCANNSRVLMETAEYANLLDLMETANIPKLSVVYKKAIGLGYSLFASKSAGFDYACAFANAKIALFDGVQGAKIEFSGEGADETALAQRYAEENSDPIHAAKNGYIDAIIEPQFVKQYLISALQMLI